MNAHTGALTNDVGAMENLRLGRKRTSPILFPVPADFAEQAKHLTAADMERHYGVSVTVVKRWFADTGIPRIYARVVRHGTPADLAERAKTSTANALQQHYGVGWDTIKRWLSETGVETAKPGISGNALGRPVPVGFAEIVPTMTLAQLERHYDVYGPTIMRWCGAVGVQPRKHVRVKVQHFGPQPGAVPSVSSSDAAQAAQFLRRHRIVYRCDILTPGERAKLPNNGRGLWYVNGRGPVSEAELISIAEGKGFDRRAWARI